MAAGILFGTMLLSGASGADLSGSKNEENEEYLNIIAHNVEYGEYTNCPVVWGYTADAE